MAQHIPISSMKQNVFRKIETSITKDFQDIRKVRGSLKYQEDRARFYCANSDEDVFLTQRFIGKGIISGQTRGNLEIHYSRFRKEVSQIYLVA